MDCNFEQNDTDCWFYDDLSVEFNWTLAYATTPSTDTGPTGDHTFLLSNGILIFLVYRRVFTTLLKYIN